MSVDANRSERDQRWYGRRFGRKLSAARQRLVDELLPQLRVNPAADDGARNPVDWFDPSISEIRMEIGFGAGEHLAGQAAAHPVVGFIGCEPFVNGVAALLDQINRQDLSNIRIFDDDVRLLLPSLPDGCLNRMDILFSDPWPKTRHHRRRISDPGNLVQFARLLAAGGELRFATDQVEFASWTLERMLRNTAFEWLARRPDDWTRAPTDWIETRYQQKARARGLGTTYLRFHRRPAPPP